MTITPKIRFEVFKRDNFTCQYCGRKQPDVILHVDHIKAKSNGGNGDMSNLITSCSICNIGKGAREIDNFLFFKKSKGLTGKWFHTKEEDGRMEYGKINWQGQILEEREDGTLHIQLYSWIDGRPTIQKIVRLDDQIYWQFYPTDKDMRDYLLNTYLCENKVIANS